MSNEYDSLGRSEELSIFESFRFLDWILITFGEMYISKPSPTPTEVLASALRHTRVATLLLGLNNLGPDAVQVPGGLQRTSEPDARDVDSDKGYVFCMKQQKLKKRYGAHSQCERANRKAGESKRFIIQNDVEEDCRRLW